MDQKISVPIYVESRYKVNRKKIKNTVARVVKENGIVGSVEVSIAIVGSRKMRSLNKKYRNIDKSTNVLSFPQMEGEAIVLPKDTLMLGDVVLSYPDVVREAGEYETMVDDRVNLLVEHGLLHLMGIHH